MANPWDNDVTIDSVVAQVVQDGQPKAGPWERDIAVFRKTISGVAGGTSLRPKARPEGLGEPQQPEFDFLKPNQPTYEIQSGDTLEGIAGSSDYSVFDLLAINPQIEDPNKLSLGQKVYIPIEDQIFVPYKVPSSAVTQNLSILDFISKGEGGYNSSNRGTVDNKIVGSTNSTVLNGRPLEENTIGEIMKAQAGGLFAVGRYQFIPSTFKMVVDQLGLPEDAVFTPEVQDQMGLQLLLGTKRPKLAAYLRGEDVDINTAMGEFAREWASVPDPSTGKSFYAGTGNKALHSVEETQAILETARQAFSGGQE